MAKPLTLLTCQKAKFKWTPIHHIAFLTLKESVIQAPILTSPDPTKWYIVYTDASYDAWGAQVSQEHDQTEFPIVFLLHTSMDTQRKWNTTEQEAYRVYYAVMKWNYYLQGAGVIVCNGHKPLARFLNRKNANNKVNRWGLELATYNITFKWILGAWNKAADCLSRLLELPQDKQATVQRLAATNHDGPAFHTRSRTVQCNITDLTLNPKMDTVTPDITTVPDTPDMTPKLLTTDRLQALLQMQRTDSFCKCISKQRSNGKAPKHELIFFYTSRDYCINMSWLQTRSSWLLSYLKHGNTQCLWKHMTNMVTRELLTYTAL